MAHKHADDRQNRNNSFDSEKLEDDIEVIELLYEQLNSIIVFFISDYFFLRYGENAIYEVLSTGEKKEIYFYELAINFIKGNLLAMAGSLIGARVNNKRYMSQSRKKLNGKITYSLNAERNIASSSVMLVILFLLQLIGAIGIYMRNLVNSGNNQMLLVEVYLMEIKAFQMRYLADYFLLESTMSSIMLVKSKYDTNDKLNYDMENPDIPAVIAGELYFIQRTMLLYSNIIIYNGLFEKNNTPGYNLILKPNIIIILGNIIGTVGNIYTLDAYMEIYMRNVNQPVFGR